MIYSDIPGWFDFHAIYDEAVRKAPADVPSRFVELGSFLGQSTAYMAGKIKESGKPITFYAVDLWRIDRLNDHNDYIKKYGEEIFSLFLKNMEGCGVMDQVVPVPSSTSDASRSFAGQDLIFDFVFVDASHKYDDVYWDIVNYWPMVAPGGTMSGHDIYMPDVKRAVIDYFSKFNLVKNLKFTPSCWMIKK